MKELLSMLGTVAVTSSSAGFASSNVITTQHQQKAQQSVVFLITINFLNNQ